MKLIAQFIGLLGVGSIFVSIWYKDNYYHATRGWVYTDKVKLKYFLTAVVLCTLSMGFFKAAST